MAPAPMQPAPAGRATTQAAPGPRGVPPRRRTHTPSASPPAATASAAGPQKTKPDWAGDDLLSKAVNVLIATKPLYAVITAGAKSVIKRGAERAGVAWDAHVRALRDDAELAAIKAELEDGRIVYPDYYTQAFHAYSEGNLNWQAAFEVEPATAAMALRTWKGEALSPDAAQAKLRGNIHAAILDYASSVGAPRLADVLDVGCSAGVSTRFLASALPDARAVTGLDLSPYFLAVAELRERQRERGAAKEDQAPRPRVTYVHANAEATRFPAASFDLVASNFVVHECRPYAIVAMAAEARRLLRPGGVYAITDNNPASSVIQNLPPALFTMMKSTEPWSDEYYQMDIPAALAAAGFLNVETREADHRHRTILAQTPPAVVERFGRMRQDLEAAAARLHDLAADEGEHDLVVRALEPMDGGRKCFRLVGDVLVERTVSEVLPSVKANRDQIGQLVAKLRKDVESREQELAAFQEKYKIRMRDGDGGDGGGAPAAAPGGGGGPGVLVG